MLGFGLVMTGLAWRAVMQRPLRGA
jgi:hypothetical protein